MLHAATSSMSAFSNKLKGKAKRAEGRLTGDRVRETQGAVEEAAGNAQGKFERTKARVNAKIDEMRAKREAKKANKP
jgi:uncharacterized protein YjbJ (UPF0337 family)